MCRSRDRPAVAWQPSSLDGTAAPRPRPQLITSVRCAAEVVPTSGDATGPLLRAFGPPSDRCRPASGRPGPEPPRLQADGPPAHLPFEGLPLDPRTESTQLTFF